MSTRSTHVIFFIIVTWIDDHDLRRTILGSTPVNPPHPPPHQQRQEQEEGGDFIEPVKNESRLLTTKIADRCASQGRTHSCRRSNKYVILNQNHWTLSRVDNVDCTIHHHHHHHYNVDDVVVGVVIVVVAEPRTQPVLRHPQVSTQTWTVSNKTSWLSEVQRVRWWWLGLV